MKKTIIIILVLVVVGIAAYYMFGKNSSNNYVSPTPTNSGIYTPTPTATPEISVSSTPKATVGASVTVDIRNFSFNPATLNIKTGTKVTWVNNDSVSHTVTSDSGSLLNSPTLSPGQSFSFTFNNAGTINYHCSIHPMIKGDVVVTK